MTQPVKRPYVSAKREAQARATRQSIVDAALRLFTSSGYAATTIQAVADEAEVAVQTVYAVFGNKRELLRHVIEAAITGDAATQPLNDRPEVRAIADEQDPRRRAQRDAAMVTQISRRLAPISRVLREAATVDPEFAATTRKIIARRRADMAAAATILAGSEGVRGDMEETIGTLYVLYSPEVFIALTSDLGWSEKRYERWLAEMLYRTVLS